MLLNKPIVRLSFHFITNLCASSVTVFISKQKRLKRYEHVLIALITSLCLLSRDKVFQFFLIFLEFPIKPSRARVYDIPLRIS